MTGWIVHDDRACVLGEGPLWHPTAGKLFWFDILSKTLMCDDGGEWHFDECVSAAGWISDTELLVASETALSTFNLATGERDRICPLEADQPATRSNDGRADPWGGFWIGTMGKDAEPNAGAIYRYYKGHLRRLFAQITISNALCFAPSKGFAYFTDTASAKVMRVLLDPDDGWPCGTATSFLDLKSEGLNPDGAITLTDGTLLNAQWGAGRVAAYGPDGEMVETYKLPTSNTTCPAMGGPNMNVMFVTTATAGLTDQQLKDESNAGRTFAVTTNRTGVPEPRVIL